MDRRRAALGCSLVLLAAPAPAQVPVGPEFPVNTWTTNDQFFPHVAADPSGGFVAVWSSNGQDRSLGGMFGQRYDAAGAPNGPEFAVNTYTTSNQLSGRVAMLPGGGFVVAWASALGDQSDRGIFARRFDANGNGGTEFLVNSYTTGRQNLPAVASDAAGNFVVAWQGQGANDGYGIFAQRFDATGAAAGGPFRVNSSAFGTQGNAVVAMDAAGGFVVAWDTYNALSGYQVRAQRFEADGDALGSEIQVTTRVGTSDSAYPSVAVAPDGRFVVAWTTFYYGGSDSGVFARRYAADGTPQGSTFQVNAYTSGDQRDPSAAMDAAGNFVVVWRSYYGQDGDAAGSFGRHFDANGVATGGEFQVNTYTMGWQDGATVAMEGNGDFVVVWTSSDQEGPGNAGNFGQRFRPDLIFRDGFESGDLSAWTASSVDAGDLSVSASAAQASTLQGLQGLVDDAAGLWVQDNSPNDERRYRARFYLDPNGFDPGEAAAQRRTRTFIAFTEGPSRRVAAVVLRRLNGVYAIMGRARQDGGGQADTGFFTISDGPHAIEIDLQPALGPDALDGSFQLWIDGVSQSELTGLDNSEALVDFARMGALSVKAAANGTPYWDEYESRRGTYIGPLP